MINKDLKDLTEHDISEIYEDYKKFHSEQNLYLPVKPYSMLWFITEIKLLNNDTLDRPDNCHAIYTEACDSCQHKDNCVTVGYPEKKWFHLDSPYITFVRDNFNSLVFDNEEDCISACKKKYNPDLVDVCVEMYHEYLNN